MTLASPSYSEPIGQQTAPKNEPIGVVPHPECEPYKKVIRELVDTVHDKDAVILKQQTQIAHKEVAEQKIAKVAENAGGTDISTVLLSVLGGIVVGMAAARVIH
jgi:hypothetical protein